jgi:hypothetical protein
MTEAATEVGILFEHVPTDIDAPVVIEATIYDITQVGDARGIQMKLMNARVDRVIRGSIDAKYLRIFVHPEAAPALASAGDRSRNASRRSSARGYVGSNPEGQHTRLVQRLLRKTNGNF